MDPLVLTFDIGTQSLRALLVNKKGETVLSYQLRYNKIKLDSDIPGRAEQEPDFYYDKLCEAGLALKRLADKIASQGSDKASFDKTSKTSESNYFNRIKAVTITCIRDTVLILDKDCKPLRNIIVWLDERRAQKEIQLPLWKKALFGSIGMTEAIHMIYKDGFCNWIMENEPELWKKTYKFVVLPSYINYKLTGQLKDGAANQVGHIPFDYRNRCWMKKGLSRCLADIPMDKLVDIVPSPGVVGYINDETSIRSRIPKGLPLISTGTDKACEALGLSVTTEDKAAISLGTASTIQFCSQHYFEPEPFLPSYPAVMPGYYNGEYQLYRGYWIVTWFIKNFAQEEAAEAQRRGVKVESILDEHLANVPLGCEGLILTPHLAPGNGNPFAKGVLMGLTDHHNKYHIYRAIIEGIDFELYHAMLRMQKRSGQQIKQLYIAGGGSVCDTVVQICADIFGLPIKRIQTHEASGIGSSLAAFVCLGEFKDYNEAVSSMVHDKDIFEPNEENHKKYMAIYNGVYKHIEKNNTYLFKRISKVR